MNHLFQTAGIDRLKERAFLDTIGRCNGLRRNFPGPEPGEDDAQKNVLRGDSKSEFSTDLQTSSAVDCFLAPQELASVRESP